MKIILLSGAALALAAGVAFAQSPGEGETVDVAGMSVVGIYYRPVPGQSAGALALAREVRKELERSRELKLVDVIDSKTIQIEAPLAIAASVDGSTLSVSYELRPARADPQAFTASCRADRLDDCAEAMVLRAERLARDTARLR